MRSQQKLLILILIFGLANPAFSAQKKKTATILFDQFELTTIEVNPIHGTVQTNAPSTWQIFGEGDFCLVTTASTARFFRECNFPGGEGSATLHSVRAASITNGTLIFETKALLGIGNGVQFVFGKLSWGLVSGIDENFSIVFSNVESSNQIACRTVSGGIQTETIVDLGTKKIEPAKFRLEATNKKVLFYINDQLVATHKTNIPTVALNPYFHSEDWLRLEYVTFEGTINP